MGVNYILKNSSQKARPIVPRSVRETQDKLKSTINESLRSDQNTKHDIGSYLAEIIPDKPIKSGNVVVEDYALNKKGRLKKHNRLSHKRSKRLWG